MLQENDPDAAVASRTRVVDVPGLRSNVAVVRHRVIVIVVSSRAVVVAGSHRSRDARRKENPRSLARGKVRVGDRRVVVVKAGGAVVDPIAMPVRAVTAVAIRTTNLRNRSNQITRRLFNGNLSVPLKPATLRPDAHKIQVVSRDRTMWVTGKANPRHQFPVTQTR
jgi:hypothetical protein